MKTVCLYRNCPPWFLGDSLNRFCKPAAAVGGLENFFQNI